MKNKAIKSLKYFQMISGSNSFPFKKSIKWLQFQIHVLEKLWKHICIYRLSTVQMYVWNFFPPASRRAVNFEVELPAHIASLKVDWLLVCILQLVYLKLLAFWFCNIHYHQKFYYTFILIKKFGYMFIEIYTYEHL